MVEKKEKIEQGGTAEHLLKSIAVSSRKIVYCEIDDEVTMIFDRLKQLKIKDIYLIVPRQAVIFQSLINLKILKRKIEEIGKNLHIITNDKNGIHLTSQVGIPVYEKIQTSKSSKPTESDEMRITPLKATINALRDERPTRRREKKVSIGELLERGRRKKIPLLKSFDFLQRKKDLASELKNETKLILVTPNRRGLFALVGVSTALLLVIFYIALPGVTLTLTPKSNVLEQSTNIVLADYESHRGSFQKPDSKMIASYPLEITVHKTFNFVPTGKIFQGSNASGTLTITNTRNSPWQLLPKTRFQTQDGVIFRIGSALTVPASGSLEAQVTADPFDAYGQPTGDRGNIKPSRLFLPGLSPENQKLLFAENKLAFTGGSTAVQKQVLPVDIKTALDQMKKDLQDSAVHELQKALDAKAGLLGKNIRPTLLKGNGTYTTSEPVITIPPDISGKTLDQFLVTGDMKVRGLYFDYHELLSLLKKEIQGKQNPQKKISKIDEESTTYRIFDTDDSGKVLKVTATMKAIEVYNIDLSKPSGERLIENIKDNVSGKRLEDAKNYIINLPEVAGVEIQSWPAWAPTIPTIPDNIDVVIRD